MRPAIDRANLRRQQTGYKIRRTIVRFLLWTAVTAATVYFFYFIASIDALIP